MSTAQASGSEVMSTRTGEDRGGRGRKGSTLTDKQIGRAAAYGRKITCRFLSSQTPHEVSGYVVGMDDYHWMIATVIPQSLRNGGDAMSLMLVHKSRVDVTLLHTDSTFDDEDEEAQAAITRVGQSFWAYCENHYNGR